MDRFFVGDEYLTLENDEVVQLKYYVLEGEVFIDDLGTDVTTYGFEIEKWTCDIVERDVVYDVTSEKEKAFDMAFKIKDNKLLPVHLKDVVYDVML